MTWQDRSGACLDLVNEYWRGFWNVVISEGRRGVYIQNFEIRNK